LNPGPAGGEGGVRCGRISPLADNDVNFITDIVFPDSDSPAEAQVQRRVQAGDTLVGGQAGADVTSITLTTPDDVRTVVPQGRNHDFIAVYDGVFYSGNVTAVIRTRNGRTYSEQVPDVVVNTRAVM
jgi:hypothetical protein